MMQGKHRNNIRKKQLIETLYSQSTNKRLHGDANKTVRQKIETNIQLLSSFSFLFFFLKGKQLLY